MSQHAFPRTRPRRLRRAEFIRGMVRETALDASQLIQPIFIAEGEQKGQVSSMPGVVRLDIPELIAECQELAALGVGFAYPTRTLRVETPLRIAPDAPASA